MPKPFAELPEEDPGVELHHLIAVVFLGGAVGAVMRVGLSEQWTARPGDWPWATFSVNVAGALLLGALLAWQRTSPRARGLVGTGFCGALTTFSTLCVEAIHLRFGVAVAYLAANLAAGLVASAVGRRVVT